MSAPDFNAVAAEYRANFAACTPQPAGIASAPAALLARNQARYESVAQKFANQIPWFAIGLIHLMEADASFGCHLHNGDPLSRRTVNEPAGRPPGQPPFTWEDSAWDALRYDRWHLVPAERWADVAGLLYQLEAYNGWGYRARHVRTPYLWSQSNLEQPGKFTGDGVFNPHATSGQVGAAVVLKALVTTGAAVFRAGLAQAAAAITA
jgi:lysozyme family protein